MLFNSAILETAIGLFLLYLLIALAAALGAQEWSRPWGRVRGARIHS